MNEHESLELGKVIVNSQAPRLDGKDFPSGPVDKNLSANAGDMSSIPSLALPFFGIGMKTDLF